MSIDVSTLAAVGTGVGTFLGSFGIATYGVIRKVRKSATQTAKQDHSATQAEIKAAVEAEQQRQAEINRVQVEALNAYKELANVRQIKIEDFAAQVKALQDDLTRVSKTNGVLSKANAQLTVEVHDLKLRLEKLEALDKIVNQPKATQQITSEVT
jgi:ATP-dependent Lon protease